MRLILTIIIIVLVSCISSLNLGSQTVNEFDIISEDSENTVIFAKFDEPLVIDLTELNIHANASVQIRWYYHEPLPLDYNNLKYCKSSLKCAQPIKYKVDEINQLRNRYSFKLRDIPKINKLGTHIISVTGLSKVKKLQIVIRRDDSYLGYLTELIGVPFVYGPAYTLSGHQTDLRQGADCVALIIYGKRRQNKNVSYMAPPKLYDYTTTIGGSSSLEETTIIAGDILHFGFQTAVISIDNPPKGKLSNNDVIIHTYHRTAEEVRFDELPYKNMPFDILRWKLINE